MANKIIRKLLQSGRSRRDDTSNRGRDDEIDSKITSSNSQLEPRNNATRNITMESRENEDHNQGGHDEVTHSSQSQRKKRGKIIMKDVHSLAPGDCLVVTFNERGQPCGEMQLTLANFVGTIARNGNVLPLDLLDWRKMPKCCLDAAWERITDLLNDAVQRHLQDKPKGTQPTEVHEEAFRDIFGPEHSGRVRCLGAGALPSQVFPDQYKPRLFLTQSNFPTSDVTNKLREMEDKMKSMEEQRQEEMERMRRMHEHQLQSFTRVIQSMISGTAGGSHEPELLPTQMTAIMTDIMQQHTDIPQNAHESRRSPSVSESNND